MFSRPDHEAATIAAVLANPSILPSISVFLRPEHFFTAEAGEAFKAMLELQGENKPINTLTVGNKTGSKSMSFLKITKDRIASVSEAIDSSQAIIDQWMLRTVHQKALNRLTGLSDTDDPWTLVEELQDLIMEVSKDKIAGFQDLASATEKMMKSAHDVKAGIIPAVVPIIGLKNFEGKIGGIQDSEGELIIVSGRPGSGKSSLFNNVLIESVKSGRPTVMWSGEMSEKETVTRYYAGTTGIDSMKIKQGGFFDDPNMVKRMEVAEIALRKTLSMYAFGGMYWEDLKPMMIHYHLAKGVRVFMLDRLELIFMKKWMHESERIKKITGELRLLATKYNLKIFLAAQMRKDVEKSRLSMPTLSDVLDATATTNDATKVFLVYRPEVHKIMELDGWGTTLGRGQLICAKNTYGPTDDDHILDYRKYLQLWVEAGSPVLGFHKDDGVPF